MTNLNETIPGGKYLAADGESFVDAWGRPVEVKEAKEAQKPAPRRKPAVKKDDAK